MVGIATQKMLTAYEQRRRPTMFLSSFFQSPQENFHNTLGVTFDIERYGEDVAVAVTGLASGYNYNKSEIYTNKEFIPPLFKEAFQLNAIDQINRMSGDTPFQDPVFQRNAMKEFSSGMRKCEEKIMRAVELQASQVLQTGTVTLKDENGNNVYTIDYKPKATHFPNAAVDWNAANPVIKTDLSNLLSVNRNDGLADSTVTLWGIRALNDALADSTFLALFNKDGATQASLTRLASTMPTNGAQFRGTIDIDHYKIEIWTYAGYYDDVETGVKTPYIGDDKVIALPADIRLDLTWGNVPIFVKPEQRVLPYLPTRINRTGRGGTDMITNAWTTQDGEHLFGGISARPLAIPTAIDQFSCLTTRTP